MRRYGSLFAGAGLLDLGLHRAIPGLDCAFAIEIDDDRRKIFGAHFDTEMHAEIESVDEHSLPSIAGLVGGIPCNTHSTTNTAGVRALAKEWTDALRIFSATRPLWTLWESSAKDKSWRRWVPAVRRDLWRGGHASVCFRVCTAPRGAPHERERAFVISWSATTDAHAQGKPARAVHEEVARLRSAPADVWDGRQGPESCLRLDDGVDRVLATAIGYGVDQRSVEDAAAVLGAMIAALSE